MESLRAAFWRLCGCRYNRATTCGGISDGDRGLLGQRQPVCVACAAGARAQAAAVREPPAAVLQAGAQVPADAGPEPAWPRAGAEGRRLRVLRVARDPLLPRSEIPAAADLRPHARGSR